MRWFPIGVGMLRTSLVLFLTVLGGIAVAQDNGVENELERADSATPEEMRAFADESVTTIKANAKVVGGLTDKARKESDAGALECLTPRNVSAQALVQVAEGAKTKLNASLDGGDRDRGAHEYRKLAVALGKSESIRGEAQSCSTGESGSGESRVGMTGGVGDDSDTEDDNPFDDIDVGFDPPNVSPSEI